MSTLSQFRSVISPCRGLRMYIANTNSIIYFVVGSVALQALSEKAQKASRTQDAYRPKTKQAYTRMIKVFWLAVFTWKWLLKVSM